MDDPDSQPSGPITLQLSTRNEWLLHHVLLDRIEQEPAAHNPTGVDPPSIEVYRAFEALDAGETGFTIAQLEGMRSVLAEYHHSTTWWELERQRIELLLHEITEIIEQHRTSQPSEDSIERNPSKVSEETDR